MGANELIAYRRYKDEMEQQENYLAESR